MKLALIIGRGFEEIEAVTLIDIFRRAGMKVDIFGIGANVITGGQNVKIQTDFILNRWQDVLEDNYQALVLPGGPGTRENSNNQELLEVIRRFNSKNKKIFAICAAPLLLEKAGILHGKKYTCYPGVDHEIKSAEKQNHPWVIDGDIMTSEGVGAALDSALKFVEIMISPDEAKSLAKKVVYYQYKS